MSRKKKPSGDRRAFRGTQQELIHLLQDMGIEVEITGGGHYRAKCPKGIVVMSRTPSDPTAPLSNIKILRRYGVPI